MATVMATIGLNFTSDEHHELFGGRLPATHESPLQKYKAV